MSEIRDITKSQLVQMFGWLDLTYGCNQEDITEQIEDYDYYTQKFTWNGIEQEIDFDAEDYEEITVHLVKETCAEHILTKIGKAIEVQLWH